ncbi:primosomal protein N' [Govanella unica]|uniref:Replication restart protein PriA n=1 Tax=Govanella unica TaxID=2975056 RepID=A0A9X3Z644_9PROT|nr:primosomal protein N' [Govania unica]
MAETVRISVLLPLPLAGAFDYLDSGLGLAPGDYVEVPLGGRQVIGVVWDGAPEGKTPTARLKPVTARLDAPPMPEVTRRFVAWVAGYVLAPPGAVLKMAMSVPEALRPAPLKTLYRRGGPLPARMTTERQALLDALIDDLPRSVRDLSALAYVGEGVVRGLIEGGTLLGVEVAAHDPYPMPDLSLAGPILSPAQMAAAGELMEAVGQGFRPILLEGVTGSGKTEVYFEAMARALENPQAQVLVLLPEIALTAQWLQRFADRFGVEPVLWHSGLTDGERRRAWRAAADGQARVVVGARSALFLPFPALALIVVDEEHDAAFKQEEGVIYQGRDMAVVRAQQGAIPVVLASATPALETVSNVRRGRYAHVHLPERHGEAVLPEVTAIDLRRTGLPRGGFLAQPLRDALLATVAAGEQALMFLNRRGYAPLTLCRTCGHRMECPQCSAWLVEHRGAGRLQCHHCGYATRLPSACPECEAEGQFAACGPGVERIAEEVAALAPDLRVTVLSSDLMASPKEFAAVIDDITQHRVDCIIGTQMVTKGYHFPKLTLVGVVDADLGLAGGDLRAAERTYQQLSQVAGRAGREALRGRVLMQTYMPEHPVMAALISGDRDAFIEAELQAREDHGMPPFGRLAGLIVSGEEADAVTRHARKLSQTAPVGIGVSVLGPVPAPLALLRGRHRWRLLVKAARDIDLQRMLRDWIARAGTDRKVRVQIDIDPYGFM